MKNIDKTSSISRLLGTFSDSIINRYPRLRTGTALGIACASALLLQAPASRAQTYLPRPINLQHEIGPLIAKNYSQFYSGPYDGFGRWGLFLEPSTLVLGIPSGDKGGDPNATFQVDRYDNNGTRHLLMEIKQDGAMLRIQGPVYNLPSSAPAKFVEPYIGGFAETPDGFLSAGVLIGSLNSAIDSIVAWNVPNRKYMNMTVGSLTIMGGADLAEPFPVSGNHGTHDLPPGSVVVIDADTPGHLKKSEQAYDTHVAGIISGAGGVNTGIQLKQEGVLEGSQNVALIGRVYVRADASSAEIQPGDLLTTSDTPGHAMKARDHASAHGAILGKAMTGLKEGKGLVLVLVSLQ